MDQLAWEVLIALSTLSVLNRFSSLQIIQSQIKEKFKATYFI
jgi:hypothetical protein